MAYNHQSNGSNPGGFSQYGYAPESGSSSSRQRRTGFQDTEGEPPSRRDIGNSYRGVNGPIPNSVPHRPSESRQFESGGAESSPLNVQYPPNTAYSATSGFGAPDYVSGYGRASGSSNSAQSSSNQQGSASGWEHNPYGSSQQGFTQTTALNGYKGPNSSAYAMIPSQSTYAAQSPSAQSINRKLQAPQSAGTEPVSAQTPSEKTIATIHICGDTNERYWRCTFPECVGVTFARDGEVKRHYYSTHDPNRELYWCPVVGCDRSKAKDDDPFPRPDKLKDHMRQAHHME